MGVNTAGGARFFIGTTERFTDAAGYETESWIEVGEVEDLGEVGDESQAIPFTALADSRTRKFKGPRDAGTQTVVCGADDSDAGQDAMIAAEASPLDYNFMIELNNPETVGGEGTKMFYYGQVMSKRRNIGNVSNVVRYNFNVGINSAVIEVDAN